jgi:hypothetical protein
MKENIHIQTIPADVLTQVQTKAREVQALLAPYMLALTSTDYILTKAAGEIPVSRPSH